MGENDIKIQNALNLIPFYAEALSARKFIWKDIDRVYEKNKYRYYKCAKNSEYYECGFAKEVSLHREEYFKKCVGILEYIQKEEKEETINAVFELFKKAYRKVYLYVKDKEEIDFLDFFDYLESIKKYCNSLSTDEFNGLLIALFFFSSNHTVVNDEEFKNLLYERWIHSCGYGRFSYSDIENVNNQMKKNISEKMNIISPNKIIEEKLLGSVIGKATPLAYIYDAEMLSSISLFEEINLSKKDLQSIILSYFIGQENLQEDCQMEYSSYIIAAMHVMAMCRVYKKVKKEYFMNNKETMYVELEYMKDKLRSIKTAMEEMKRKENECNVMKDREIERLKKENDALNRKLKQIEIWKEQQEDKSVELEALRNFIFTLENLLEEEIPGLEDDGIRANVEILNMQKGIIIGGNVKWQQKMKEYLPNWSFKLPSKNLEESVLRQSKALIFNTSCLNHSMYYKAIDAARYYHIPVGYIKSTNIKKSLQQICYFFKI